MTDLRQFFKALTVPKHRTWQLAVPTLRLAAGLLAQKGRAKRDWHLPGANAHTKPQSQRTLKRPRQRSRLFWRYRQWCSARITRTEPVLIKRNVNLHQTRKSSHDANRTSNYHFDTH